MQRRELLRLLGGAASAAALAPRDAEALLALGRDTHAAVRAGRAGGALDARALALLGALADRIIPDTDTPGATAAGVPAFADLLLATQWEPERVERFRQGLAELDRRSQRASGRLFVDASPAEQESVLHEVEDETFGATPGAVAPFWKDCKWLVLYGYYTSEIGITEELRTVDMFERYEGAAPLPARRP